MHTQVEITFPLRNAEDLKGSHPFSQMTLKKSFKLFGILTKFQKVKGLE